MKQLLRVATFFAKRGLQFYCRLDPNNSILQAERKACIEAWKASNPTTLGPARVKIALEKGNSEAERRKALDAAFREAEHRSEMSGSHAGEKSFSFSFQNHSRGEGRLIAIWVVST